MYEGAVMDPTIQPMVVRDIPLSTLKDNPYQKRKKYRNIEGLANSITKRGLKNPISVIKLDEVNIIVSGHRRVRAYRYLRRKTIPGFICKQSTKEDLCIDIAVENLQREDLSPVEKGETLEQLLYTLPSVRNNPSRALTLLNQIGLFEDRGDVENDFAGKLGFREEDLFNGIKMLKLVGMSVNTAMAYIRIIKLPEEILDKIVAGNDGHTCAIPDGKISVKTAYELTRIKDPKLQKELFEKAIADKLKYIEFKFVVDEVIDKNKALGNRNCGHGSAGRRLEDDAGAAALTTDIFKLSSKIYNFRKKLPLACKRLDKILLVASFNKMKKACLEMILAINNVLRDDMEFEGWLKYVNADLEITMTKPSREGENLRFSIPMEKGAALDLGVGDKLLIKIESVVRAGPVQPAEPSDDHQENETK